jgi:hypothetical protein
VQLPRISGFRNVSERVRIEENSFLREDPSDWRASSIRKNLFI